MIKILTQKKYLPAATLALTVLSLIAFIRPGCSLYGCAVFGYVLPWSYLRDFIAVLIWLMAIILLPIKNRCLLYFMIGILLGYFLVFEVVPVNFRFFGEPICGK